MRRVAADLHAGVMSIYRHLPGKAELLRLMADAAFAERRLPQPGPDNWRERLEVAARLQWSIYRRHPWVAGYVLASPASPHLVPHAIDHVEWELQALARLGSDQITMLRAVVSLHSYVGGAALNLAVKPDTEQGNNSTGVMASHEISRERFPIMAQLQLPANALGDLDALFEFGLQRQLDGIALLLNGRASKSVI
jgi:AcrR family transcriptional regulator